MEKGACGGVKKVDNKVRRETENDELETFINTLKEVANSVLDDSVNYYIFYYGNSSKRKINAFKTSINESIGKRLSVALRDSIKSLQSNSIYDYEDNDSENNQDPELIESGEVPRFKEIMTAIAGTEDMLSLSSLKDATSPKFAITMGNITGFGVLRKVSYLKEKRSFMSLNDSGVFNEIDDAVLLEVPDSIPAFHFDGKIVIFSEGVFESIFNYHEKIMSTLENKMEYSQKLFSDTDLFYNSIRSDSRKARKLFNAYNSDYITSLKVSDIVDYAAEFNLDIKINQDDDKIDFASSNAWHVVKAICEDFFTGRWSKNHFSANNKFRLNGK